LNSILNQGKIIYVRPDPCCIIRQGGMGARIGSGFWPGFQYDNVCPGSRRVL